jgi:hypothetical protein
MRAFFPPADKVELLHEIARVAWKRAFPRPLDALGTLRVRGRPVGIRIEDAGVAWEIRAAPFRQRAIFGRRPIETAWHVRRLGGRSWPGTRSPWSAVEAVFLDDVVRQVRARLRLHRAEFGPEPPAGPGSRPSTAQVDYLFRALRLLGDDLLQVDRWDIRPLEPEDPPIPRISGPVGWQMDNWRIEPVRRSRRFGWRLVEIRVHTFWGGYWSPPEEEEEWIDHGTFSSVWGLLEELARRWYANVIESEMVYHSEQLMAEEEEAAERAWQERT